MDWMESLVERRIREAMERGDFDDLPGAGRPLDLHDANDPDWWLKRYVRDEGIDLSLALPGPLALRKEAEGFPGSLSDVPTEEAVRAVLEDFNARVEADWRAPVRGRPFPVQAYQVDVEDLVRQWRGQRPHTGPHTTPHTAPHTAPPVDPGPDEPRATSPRTPRRRWWRRTPRS